VPKGRPAWPARVPSREGVPVEVVGRPSIGEGRIPGIVCMGTTAGVAGGDDKGSDSVVSLTPPNPVRVSATLRLRKAIVEVGGGVATTISGGGFLSITTEKLISS
jgi:hypothetical protein